MEYQSIKTKSGTCGYATLGNGAPMILVVGYTGTLFHWHGKFVHELAKHFKLYLIDNRKIGLSDSNNEESVPGLASDIADFIDAMNLHKPYILGWSMGGVLIQELLKQYPDKIKSAIFVASVSKMFDLNPDFYAFLQSADSITEEEFRKKIYYFFFSHQRFESLKDKLTDSALKFNNYTYRFDSTAKQLQDHVLQKWLGVNAEDLAQFNLPILLLWAKNDLVVTQNAVLFHVNHIPQAKLIIYPSGGHFLLQENYLPAAYDIINFVNFSGH